MFFSATGRGIDVGMPIALSAARSMWRPATTWRDLVHDFERRADATVEKVYDNLDFQRGVQAFLTPNTEWIYFAGCQKICHTRSSGVISRHILVTKSR